MRSPRLRLSVALLIACGTLVYAGDLHASQEISNGIFHLKPRRPIEELRAEALRATPPAEAGPFRRPDLVELVRLDPTIRLDIRYASDDNFLSTPMYSQARAFLQRRPPRRWSALTRSCAQKDTESSSTMLIGPGTSPKCFGRQRRRTSASSWPIRPPAQNTTVAVPSI